MEPLFTSLIINAHEEIYLAIFHFSGSYVKTDMPEEKFILLNIEGECVNIMCKVNPEHNKNVPVDNGVKVLYLRLTKAFYGCMESALLWYYLYLNTLTSQGFLINIFYRCISDSTIKYKQCTISWYVDDNKVSHVDEEVNKKLIETIYENLGNLTVSRGNKHKFLGMDIEFLAGG